MAPGRYLLFATPPRPSRVIGTVGTLLGEHRINIAGMHVGREEVGQRAVMVLTLDDPVPEPLLAEIQERIDAELVRFVEL